MKEKITMISLLVAMDTNHVIGAKNDLPWHLPNDLKFFKAKTVGHTIVMGRKTYESIGRPLPNRRNIVITRSESADLPKEVEVIHHLDDIKALEEENPSEEYFVIGGGSIFEQVIDYADRMYITLIKATFPGDTYFPAFNEKEWQLTKKEQGMQDDKNPYEYYFLQYDRIV